MLDYYRGARDLNIIEREERGARRGDDFRGSDRRDRGDRRGDRNDRFEGRESGDNRSYSTGERLFINLGKADGLDKGTLLGMICDRSRIKKHSIGKIDLKGVYSFFEVEPGVTHTIMNNLNGFDFKGRIIRIENQSTEPKRRK